MKLLVTGAGGLLGRAVLSEAGGRGYDVVALDHARLDVTDEAAVGAAVSDARADAVVHCAAYTAVDRAEAEPQAALAVNRDGTRHVAAAAAEAGAVLLYVSTDYVFDGRKGTPYRPDDPTGPLSAYGSTKLEGERAAARHASEHLVARTSWLYGEDNGFVPAILRRAEAGEPLRVVDDQRGRPTWAPQAATALLDLLEQGARGVWHVAGGGECTWLELAEELLRQEGLDVPITPVTSQEFGAAAVRPAYSVLDLEATERLLGREMTDWRDALSRFLQRRTA
jgi:dTDP-4-dehydrorhamnose reductase